MNILCRMSYECVHLQVFCTSRYNHRSRQQCVYMLQNLEKARTHALTHTEIHKQSLYVLAWRRRCYLFQVALAKDRLKITCLQQIFISLSCTTCEKVRYNKRHNAKMKSTHCGNSIQYMPCCAFNWICC